MGVSWHVDRYVRAGLFYETQDAEALRRHVDCVEDTDALRKALPGLGLVAFVGNGSVLPRSDTADAHKIATYIHIGICRPCDYSLAEVGAHDMAAALTSGSGNDN